MKPTTELIVLEVEQYFGLEHGILHRKTRKREIVQPRQIAMYFAKILTKDSLASIGMKIGSKDHATVLHASKTINNLVETDKSFRKMILNISEIINTKYPEDKITKNLADKSRESLINMIVILSSDDNKNKIRALKMIAYIKNIRRKRNE